jgi:hypothetical protein
VPLTAAIEEREYWLELEGLLARFHQDLGRVIATLEGIEEYELVRLLERAQTNVGGACCAAAERCGAV